MTQFGKRLRFLRLQNKLTQKELAKIINTSTSAIGMYERGEREPSFTTLLNIATNFNVSLDYLLGNDQIQNHSFPKLNDDQLKLIEQQLKYSDLFHFILNASPEQLRKLALIIKVLE